MSTPGAPVADPREPERAAVRERLVALSAVRREAERSRADTMAQTRPLVRQGHALGIGPTELERLTGLSRRSIYDLLEGDE